MNRFHFLRSLSRYDHFSVCCPYFTSFFVLNLLATISEPALAVRDALTSLRPVSPRSLEIFRVAFLFVCQIIPAAFTARSGSRIPAALEVFPRRNSDIISSHPITVNMFFNLFFTSVFSVLPAVISAVRHPFFSSGKMHYSISVFKKQRLKSNIRIIILLSIYAGFLVLPIRNNKMWNFGVQSTKC